MKLYQVDAFTSRPFRGNPAAVCLLNRPAPASWMQNLAQEMNLSETAFLVTQPEDFGLRWFTPKAEVELCGHATLASAHVLLSEGLASGPLRFHTLSGVLEATQVGDQIELNFPATPADPCPAPDGLLPALGLEQATFVGKSRFDYLVVVDDLTIIRPDLQALAQVEARGVIVTGPSQDYDFQSRFFAPAVGVPEDPVTGSAHCTLAPYWSERLGKTSLEAYQASSRGGQVSLRLEGERVALAGGAVTVFEAELRPGTVPAPV